MKAVYIYENHLDGSYYVTEKELTHQETRCDSCGDSDTFVAKIKTLKDIKNFENQYKFLRCNNCGEYVYQSYDACPKCRSKNLSLTRTYQDTIDVKYIKKFINKLKTILKEKLWMQ